MLAAAMVHGDRLRWCMAAGIVYMTAMLFYLLVLTNT